MYNLVFAFFYHLIKKRNSGGPRFNAAGSVFLAVLFHVLSLDAIIREFFGYSVMDVFPDGQFSNKYSFLPIVIVIWLFAYLYFSPKRIKSILAKYGEENIHSFKNSVFVALIYIVPLSIIIYLSS